MSNSAETVPALSSQEIIEIKRKLVDNLCLASKVCDLMVIDSLKAFEEHGKDHILWEKNQHFLPKVLTKNKPWGVSSVADEEIYNLGQVAIGFFDELTKASKDHPADIWPEDFTPPEYYDSALSRIEAAEALDG